MMKFQGGKGGAALVLALVLAIAAPTIGGGAARAEPPVPADPQPAQIRRLADAGIVRSQDGDEAATDRGPVTNLPLPRYVSLKGSEGNARRGPSLSHRIDWVFRHAGMPLRVVAEFGHWRRVEDKDGAGGWVHYAMLSGVRTALVTEDMVQLRSRPNPDADVVARAEVGAILRLGECNPTWCRISGGGQRGWVPKSAIWGVDPDEIRD
ncbi:MAG: SH3 domain-containing protein [Paracoccus sp. (in: a-proteobacteria)]|uniref:SH3 domain-containing protein n=1 Tax=unclassified Paracoccus (in: a-proteobacteria) TaxID=2688777 RepID=UPI0025E5C9C7|nr:MULTISPECIES: SH3 domain-containing protein [unclassified Paracoccus (in: a-proteobacteria)]|tara:strand:- start:50 stop:673 length:624 start_codon:yes stop_codon:yes gene_type:complete